MASLKLFNVGSGGVSEIPAWPVERERRLQELVEQHMQTFLGVRFLASEYSTGPRHGGRIDSLGLDENGAPVIIEYKRGQDAGVINQGLFYLSWLIDHKAEFQHLVRERLGAAAAGQVLWSDPRLVCIAEDFTRYDAHAIGEIQRTIDLVRYRYFGNDLLALEPVASVTAGRSQSRPRRAVVRSSRLPSSVTDELRSAVDEVLVSLGDDVTQVDRKQYRAYRRLRNFACVSRMHKQQVLIYLNIDPGKVDLIPGFTRDVSDIGHHGTGPLEVRLRTERDLERAIPLFRLGYADA
ncbi:transporter [Streptomyces sp. NPDC001262]|uniref:transporter n=1 Tax=Streptomyces sp. NPDC001262 TaxID=3364552 RepID=UPI0036738FCA